MKFILAPRYAALLTPFAVLFVAAFFACVGCTKVETKESSVSAATKAGEPTIPAPAQLTPLKKPEQNLDINKSQWTEYESIAGANRVFISKDRKTILLPAEEQHQSGSEKIVCQFYIKSELKLVQGKLEFNALKTDVYWTSVKGSYEGFLKDFATKQGEDFQAPTSENFCYLNSHLELVMMGILGTDASHRFNALKISKLAESLLIFGSENEIESAEGENIFVRKNGEADFTKAFLKQWSGEYAENKSKVIVDGRMLLSDLRLQLNIGQRRSEASKNQCVIDIDTRLQSVSVLGSEAIGGTVSGVPGRTAGNLDPGIYIWINKNSISESQGRCLLQRFAANEVSARGPLIGFKVQIDGVRKLRLSLRDSYVFLRQGKKQTDL